VSSRASVDTLSTIRGASTQNTFVRLSPNSLVQEPNRVDENALFSDIHDPRLAAAESAARYEGVLITDPATIHVAAAADDAYAMPLAVTMRSAVNNLAPTRRLHWYVIDGGMTPQSKERVLQSCEDARLTVSWLKPELSQLDFVPISGRASRMMYVRVLLPELLPSDLARVLYLDSDLLVLRNLGDLWDEPVADWACLACIDTACPYIDASVGLKNFWQCGQHLICVRPIPNYQQLGLDPRAQYFNSGVLSVNLEYWRRQEISAQLLQCLRANEKHLICWDQYALNVVLHRRWGRLDLRWNQGTQVFRFPRASASPVDARTLRTLRISPWIVHFTTSSKPWHYENRHPFRRRFFDVMDQTAWRDWRPAAPYRTTGEWITYQCRRWERWYRDHRRRREVRRRFADLFRSTVAKRPGAADSADDAS
jgi:lipopolysaccharide biosynthesis glycosyltransferase